MNSIEKLQDIKQIYIKDIQNDQNIDYTPTQIMSIIYNSNKSYEEKEKIFQDIKRRTYTENIFPGLDFILNIYYQFKMDIQEDNICFFIDDCKIANNKNELQECINKFPITKSIKVCNVDNQKELYKLEINNHIITKFIPKDKILNNLINKFTFY